MSIRYGLIGLGMMGRHHARVNSRLEGAELVALADPMGDPHNVAGSTPIFDSVDGLISGVDAAVVAVPTRFHEEVGLKLAGRSCTRLSRSRLRIQSRQPRR